MNSVPHFSTFHRVRQEGPNKKICFQFRGLTETSALPSSTFVLQISNPSTSEQSLELDKQSLITQNLGKSLLTHHTVILKSGIPDRVTSILPLLEKEKLVYSKVAPPRKTNKTKLAQIFSHS